MLENGAFGAAKGPIIRFFWVAGLKLGIASLYRPPKLIDSLEEKHNG
jgi:hypothetical protein